MSLQEYREVIARAAEPLKVRLAEIEGELTLLKDEKAEIEAILRKTDQLPKKNGKPKAQATTVAPATLDRFFTKLTESFPVGELFYTSMLEPDPRFDFISASHIAKALRALHEDGRIALHSTGIGGRKNYMVVR